MHKSPEDRMWLPTGGQIGMATYAFLPRHRENTASKQASIIKIHFKTLNLIDFINFLCNFISRSLTKKKLYGV